MTATTVEPTRVTRRTTVVETGTPATTEAKGFGAWLRRMGEALRRGWNTFWGGVKRAATWSKDKTIAASKAVASGARRGGSRLWSGVKWVGAKLYWSGATVGRGLGRGARFFGRSSLGFAKATGRISARTVGWGLRATSWGVRTGIEALFMIGLAGWMIMGITTMFLASAHDGYEKHVHTHAKAASRGEYREDAPYAPGAAEARKQFADAATVQADRVAHWNVDLSHDTATVEEEIPVVHFGDFEDKLAFWQIREPDLPLPEDISFENIMDVMSATKLYSETPLPYTEREYLITNPSPEAKKLTDNEIWLGHSYWDGRNMATTTFDAATREVDLMQPWETISHQIKTRMGAGWTQQNKNLQHLYASRERHENSCRKGWQDQTTYLLGWFEQFRKRVLSAQQLEEAETPPPAKKAAAKKATAKKTAGSA